LYQGREGHGPPIRIIDNADYFGQGCGTEKENISRVTELGTCDGSLPLRFLLRLRASLPDRQQ
jgi:hypothetical protein